MMQMCIYEWYHSNNVIYIILLLRYTTFFTFYDTLNDMMLFCGLRMRQECREPFPTTAG